VRHNPSRHLLQPVIPRVVAVAFTVRPAHDAHEPALGVIGECIDPVPGQVAARVIGECRPVHTRYAVRLNVPHFLDHRILQLIAATYRVPHSRQIPVQVIIKLSLPRSPARRR
jgi:hypothetical protein